MLLNSDRKEWLYSRRQFLKLSGVTLLNLSVSGAAFFYQDEVIGRGRTLEATPVFPTSNLSSPATGHLWPDTIVAICDHDEAWYQIPAGFVSRYSVQPIAPVPQCTNHEPTNVPFWAEVASAVAPVRQWCSADAPPITRIGHGGVVRVIDYLPAEPNGVAWYRLDSGIDKPLGWTQAAFWRPVCEESQTIAWPCIELDRRSQTVTAFNSDNPLLQASFSLGTELTPGHYQVRGRQFSGHPVYVPGQVGAFYGVPWRVQFGNEYEIAGAYWHNHFGEAMPGPAVQIPPLLARWLYYWLGNNGIINVI